MMLNLSYYQETNQLYAGNRTLVYRAISSTTEQPVIIKVLRNPHPNFDELVQFRNQYVITRYLEHPTIVQPLALERYGNGYALVMPDEGAIALWEYWQQLKHSLMKFLSIAIQLAESLHYLTQQRIIHKDIKPANILIHPDTGQVQLIDFSISSLLPKEQQQLINPNVLEGTLAYISPEQTGRMNRGIDYRTDFYSLGVTFFELLNGKLPFETGDPMELVHCHIAQEVKFPGNSEQGVPEMVQAIVLKLMAKNAEERYQSSLGLKHDLERCLQQLESTGEITSFVLGERDACDRFLIHEKLYGREAEVQSLLDAFERVANPPESPSSLNKGGQRGVEMMLVAGFSGIGKTAVVNEVHKPIVKKRGYFIKGKYDQFNRNLPFSAFLQAFRDLMRQLLGESDADLVNWKAKITEALGQNGQVIIDVIPELEQIIGKQPPVPELSGSAAQNRFNLVFGKFITSLTSPEHPLVMFLDDLQWADLASLNLMEVLMGDSNIDYLLLLGAYRDNEVFPAHPLMLSLAELGKTQAVISTITLEPLARNHINQLVADTLNCSEQLAQPLTELVYQKTKGNPFFTTQFLKGLHEDGLIQFNLELGYWECDLVQVRDVALTDDVVEFMAGRLRKLPSATQNVLKLAACIGNQFELETLAVICEESSEEVAADMWRALQEGLILPISEAYKFFQGDVEDAAEKTVTVGYRFLHDRVQQAAYFLIPEDQKQKTHLKIGRLLLENTSVEDREEQLFDIVNHLNTGVSLIVDLQEKKQLCELNLAAGIKAKNATAFAASIEYLLLGIELLPENSWEQDYEVTLALYQSAMESAYLNGDFQQMEQFANVGLENSRNLLDTIKIYEVTIEALGAQSRFQESIDTAMVILGKLGIRQFPQEPDSSDVELWLNEVRDNLGGRHPSSLIDLPVMTDLKALAAIKILINLLPSTYTSKPNLSVLVCFEQVNLSLKYGNAPFSAFSYATHALALCSVCQDIEVGAQFCELALQLLERGDTAIQARTIQCVYHTKHGKEHLRNTLKGFKQGYSIALETGDLEFAGYTLSFYSTYSYLCSQELSSLAQELSANSKALERIKKRTPKNWIDIVLQTINNLLGRSEDPSVLVGEGYDQEKMLPLHQEANDVTALSYFYIARSMLGYLLQDYSQAFQNIVNAEKFLGGVAATPWENIFYFYSSLVMLAEIAAQPKTEYQALLEKIAANQKILNNAAVHAPENNLHKWHLVEAEKHRVLGEKMAAMERYDEAISGAQEQGYIQEEALANELAAKFYLDWGKEKVAAGYMQEAYYCYARWGAKVKTEQLEEQYPQLLSPILQQAEPLLTSSNFQANTKNIGKVTTAASVFDLTSAIKASQAVSEEIELDVLLSKLMYIVLENAGANAGTLILNNSGTWEIVAQSLDGNCYLSTIPLEQTDNLPSNIINTVKRTQQVLLINNVEQDTTFARDSYLIQNSPQSLCCSPILNQGKLIGILYLENNLTAEAFTSDRLKVLNLLTAQAAISIENARLYQTLEDKVKERTAQLARANQEISALNEKLQEENFRLSAELEITKQLQQMVLPKQSELEVIEGLEIAGFMEPADEVGGDYYDVLPYNGGVKIGIGDVTGHGLESGVLMLMTQTAVRTLQEVNEIEPVKFLDALNRTIYRNLERMNSDKNLTLAILDYHQGTLSLSGQHEEMIVVRADGEIEQIDTIDLGFPIGLDAEIVDFIATEKVQLNLGDVVILYTDGITEAENMNREQYGLEKLISVVSRNSSQSGELIRQAVIEDVRRHIGEQKVFDDITLVVLKQK